MRIATEPKPSPLPAENQSETLTTDTSDAPYAFLGALSTDWVTCKAQIALSNRRQRLSGLTRCVTMIPLPEKGGLIVCPTCHSIQ